ncbi:MAG: chaperone modulatory protein CbpM [Paraglaciecola sp.]|jgi:chaperone modulatory protein CbpM
MGDTILKISLTELCEAEQINEELIIEVVEYGIAQPVAGKSVEEWIFDPTSVHWLKKAIRLNRELEIDWVAVAMVIELLKQKEHLQQENQNLQHQLARFL